MPASTPDPLLRPFRRIAFVEGISYLVLLGIAMPLKYFADMPLAVRVVGMAHGLLFIAYVILAGLLFLRRRWSFLFTAWALWLSIVPFGTFLLERQLARAEAPDPADSE